MGPALQPFFCRAGPVCPAGSAVRNRRADRGVRPYGSVTGGAMGGRPQGSPLRKRYKRCGEVWNPPVTASPCQPPLGKGAEGTGVTDCHSQCAHWLRNDMVFTRGAVQDRRATARVAPTEALQGVQWAGDRKGRPYGGLRGMCGLGIGPCGSFLTGREWYVSDFGGGG